MDVFFSALCSKQGMIIEAKLFIFNSDVKLFTLKQMLRY